MTDAKPNDLATPQKCQGCAHRQYDPVYKRDECAKAMVFTLDFVLREKCRGDWFRPKEGGQ